MISDKVKKIESFKKLMEIAKKRSVDLWAYSDDFYKGGRNWPVDWEKELGNGRFENEQERQNALNSTLERLVRANPPSSVGQLQKEKKLTRLILDAGADPNYYYCFHGQKIFDDFLSKEKFHMALEVAKTEGFMGPEKPAEAFKTLADKLTFYLHWKEPFPGYEWDNKEKIALYAQDCLDQKELVCTLFEKGMYPRDKAVFEKLAPIVLEKDPEFFNKKKIQVLVQMKRARTPVQIFNALMGNRKEKLK